MKSPISMVYRGYFVEFMGVLNTAIWQTLSPPYRLIKPLFLQGFFYMQNLYPLIYPL